MVALSLLLAFALSASASHHLSNEISPNAFFENVVGGKHTCCRREWSMTGVMLDGPGYAEGVTIVNVGSGMFGI